MKPYKLLLISYFFNILTAYCQDPALKIQQSQAIRQLKKGSLLVRLESKDKKMKFLRQIMEQSKCDADCQADKQRELDEVLRTSNDFNLAFIQAFHNHFKFCRVHFYYDKDHAALKSSAWSAPLFLDDSLRYITKEISTNQSTYVLYKDVTPESEAEGWMIQDLNGESLGKGFPFVIQNNAKTLMTYFSSSDHLRKNCNYLVKKLNKDLQKYYLNAELKSMEGELEMNK